ncbi:MAG TPA: MotA/TolQ/ExbB proton channel family protein [Rhodoferax sp.]|nr:MotA/TolQ/ExbB proton channel family protein [Rhodoferax sp.]
MKVNQLMLSCACVLMLALPLVPDLANAQSDRAPVTQPVAAGLPVINDVNPVAGTGAEVNKAGEPTENPYGLESLWRTSDAVARTVLLLLLIMSAGSWYILVVKVLEQSKMMRQAKAAAKDFWSAGTVEQGAAALEAGSPYRFMAEAAGRAVTKHVGLRGHVDLNDWIASGIQRAVDRIQSKTQGGLAFLATVGSIAPFVGLFGTVWGIYHALIAIGISGQASIDKVAGPVGEALLMTAIGLAVAVPAVLSYNWLVRRNKAVMDDVRAFSGELHAVVLGSVNKA